MYKCQAVSLWKDIVLMRFNTTNIKVQSKVKQKLFCYDSYFIRRKLCFIFIITLF